jgi:large subunit ribosomal protein L4
MLVDVYKKDGKKSGKQVELPEDVFGVEPKEHAVYLAVKAQLANARQGTHKTKTRHEVRGGGKKPWKQKGRGVARAGTIRSPLWVGGGRVFGPTPRDYGQDLPKKVKRLARRSVLSAKLKDRQLVVVEDFQIDSGKTRDMAAVLNGFEVGKQKALMLMPSYDEKTLKASRNIPNLRVQVAEVASTYEMLDCSKLFILQSAIEKLAGVNKA